MPKKSVIVHRQDVRCVEVYSVYVTCPYCGENEYVEEEYCEPEDYTCFNCNKLFKIKYDDTKKHKNATKPKKSNRNNKK